MMQEEPAFGDENGSFSLRIAVAAAWGEMQ